MAELAVAVVDDWQRRGVGTRLVTELARRAREEGINSFAGLVLADNKEMLNLISELGGLRTAYQKYGTVELTVDLPETGPGRLKGLLRAVGRGAVKPLPRHHQAR